MCSNYVLKNMFCQTKHNVENHATFKNLVSNATCKWCIMYGALVQAILAYSLLFS